jgi:hypothetical protein
MGIKYRIVTHPPSDWYAIGYATKSQKLQRNDALPARVQAYSRKTSRPIAWRRNRQVDLFPQHGIGEEETRHEPFLIRH